MFSMREKCFLAVAKTGNFTKASEMMYISQPAVSKHILLLEEELGFPLFERNTRSVRLTEPGKILYERMQNIHAMWDDALRSAQKMNINRNGILRVGMLNGWDIHNTSFSFIDDFKSYNPQVEVIIEKHNYKDMAALLDNNALDIIITMLPEIKGYSNFNFQFAFSTPLLLLLNARTSLAKGNTASEILHSFNEVKVFVLSDSVKGLPGFMDSFCCNYQICPRPNIESILIALELEENGICFTMGISQSVSSPGYKAYDIGAKLDCFFAWKTCNFSQLIGDFLAQSYLSLSKY